MAKVEPASSHFRAQTDSTHPENGGSATEGAPFTDMVAGTTRTYKRRWYILLVSSLYSLTQPCVWNTFGPISSTSKKVFSWTDANISMLSACGPIGYLVIGPVFAWIIESKGIRQAYLLSSFAVAVGTAFRCITFKPPAVTGFMTIGHMLNGFGGPVALCGSSAVSAVWFPCQERTTALAIGTVAAFCGLSLSFVIGPNIVPDIFSDKNTTSESRPSSASTTADVKESPELSNARDTIAKLMYIEACWSTLVFFLILVYFPNKPPAPPSQSASTRREDYWNGVVLLLGNPHMMLVVAVYSLSIGMLNSWTSLLNLILESKGVGQKTAGWCGFYGLVSACFVSLTVARFTDAFMHFVKGIVFTLILTALTAVLIFTFAYVAILPPSSTLFYATIITVITSINTLIPMMVNLACELAYPVGEGTAASFLTLSANVVIMLFLLIMMSPHIGSAWLNWALVTCLAVSLPLLTMVKVTFKRLEFDLLVPNPSPQGNAGSSSTPQS